MNYYYWNDLEVYRFSNEYQKIIPPELERQWAKADMILGDARTGCQGAGICKISVRGDTALSSKCGCSAIPIWLGRINEHLIQLAFDKRLLTFNKLKLHYKHRSIKISRDIKLPLAVSKALGFQRQIVITAKQYPLMQEGHYFHHYLHAQEL